MNLFLSIRFDSPELLIWAACVGFNVAIIFTYILKGSVSKLISKLEGANAFDNDSAATLSSIGAYNLLICYLLRDDSTLRKVVKAQNGVLVTKKSKKGTDVADFNESRFYLDASNDKKIASLKKSAIKWWLIPIFAIVSIILASTVIYLLPILSV